MATDTSGGRKRRRGRARHSPGAAHPLAEAIQVGAEALRAIGRPYALVGGLAVSARAAPRTTRDVDFAVAVESDVEAEAVLFELRQRGFELKQLLENVRVRRIATARMLTPRSAGARTIVDILFATSGIEAEVASAATQVEIPGVATLPIAMRPHLLAMKVLSRKKSRPNDDIDIAALLERSPAGEIEQARRLLKTITQRGFNRGQPLLKKLDQAVKRGKAARVDLRPFRR